MSLLMKALEKAAKDREDAGAGREAAVPADATAEPALGILSGASMAPPAAAKAARSSMAKSELTLEPLTAPAEPRIMPLSPPPSPSSTKPVAPAPAAASRESILAATMVRAGAREHGGLVGAALAYVRDRPLVVFGPLAAVVLIGYGTYIYLQMASPATFAKQVPRSAPPPPAPPAAATSSAPALAPAPGASAPVLAPAPGVSAAATAQQRPIPLTALLSPTPEGVPRERLSSVSAAAAPAARAPASAKAPAPSPAPAAPAAAQPARDTIKVTAGGAAPSVNPLLAKAYALYSAGDLDSAPQVYNQLLRSEPNNVDALLGLAAIARQQGDGEQASRHYLKVLEVEPRNSLAQAGLIGMLGRADPPAAESRLKQLIARDPSAYLHFTLGNLYADQNRWPDAQQAYFQAHHLQSDNPEYAYNLAVGLEHVGQPKLALEYYRKALELATAKGRVNFSTAAVEERIGRLAKAVE